MSIKNQRPQISEGASHEASLPVTVVAQIIRAVAGAALATILVCLGGVRFLWAEGKDIQKDIEDVRKELRHDIYQMEGRFDKKWDKTEEKLSRIESAVAPAKKND